MNILDNFSKDSCCGCTACKSICPRDAIRMKPDEKGFLYPVIDSSLCVDCGLCVDVCVHAVKGGSVFGCEMVDKYTIAHTCHSDKQGVDKFKGSKYVQSDLRDTFRTCQSMLKEGKAVLFSGTGCQVHGLLSYLSATNTNTENLLTCDIVCHGCPSPEVWKIFVDVTEQKEGKHISAVDFRDKHDIGWKGHVETLYFDDASKRTGRNWQRVFYSHVLFRDSCFKCKYTTIHRKTDFTIADCWGVEKVAPEFDDDKGGSLLLINTEKGAGAFEAMKGDLDCRHIDVMEVLQLQLKAPSVKGKEYDRFWQLYSKDKEGAVRYFFYPPLTRRLVKKVKRTFFK